MDKKIILSRMRKSPFFIIGGILVILIVAASLCSPLFIGFDPTKNSLLHKLQPPEWFAKGFQGHILGTDQMGRDLFARVLVGAKSSLMIASSVTLVTLFVGTILGLISGYMGGRVDSVIMRLCDIVLTIPGLILAIVIMAVLGTNTTNLVIALCCSEWVGYCRLTRNNVLVIRDIEYVNAIKVLGGGKWRIVFKEILPNVLTPLIVTLSTNIGVLILTESSLSFLNMGVQPPAPSWGNMIASGRNYLATFPWVVLVPGIALMITILSFNFLGDGLRDVLDPKRT